MDRNDGIRQLNAEVKATLVTGAGFWQTAECAQIGMPSVRLSDGPNGMRVQHKRPSQLGMGTSLPATSYPTASAAACSFNTELLTKAGEYIAKEAAAQGVSMILGPGLNIKRSSLCGRNFEYFSEDPVLSGRMAAAYVAGIQSTGVTACIKHFAANSREYARMYCDSRVDIATLRELYLTGFEIAVKDGGAGAVMTAYNRLNGEYCNQNGWLIGGVLRGEWGFDGVVVSDWGGSHDPVAALKAGADLEMPCCKFSAPQIAAAVANGELKEEILDGAVRRVSDFARASQGIERKPFDIEEHHIFARRFAEECLVLLKNDGGALPIKDGERVALVGSFAKKPRYQGAGSSQVIPTKLTSLYGEMQKRAGFVGFAEGYKRFGGNSGGLIKKAVKLAKKADTVIAVIGLDEQREAEGSDRADLKLSSDQPELLKALKETGKKVIAVLVCGSAVETDWSRYVDALLLAHLGGQAGAEATVRALYGEVNPSGRLAETYPLRLKDEPCFAAYNESPIKSDYAEGIYVGYRYFCALNKPVAYPFGYGLSYTTFEYSGFALSMDGVRVKVKNTGGVAGATVAQVYVTAPRSNLKVSPPELKLFKKVYLEASEERELFLPFDEYSFRIFNVEKNSFKKGGKYAISLRENAQSVLFEGTLEIEGEVASSVEAQSYENYYLSNLTIAGLGYKTYKGMPASPDMQVADLKYCRGITAKLFAFIARRTARSKNKLKAGLMEWLPVRSLMQFMNLNAARAEGFLLMCDGKFFKGLGRLISGKSKGDKR